MEKTFIINKTNLGASNWSSQERFDSSNLFFSYIFEPADEDSQYNDIYYLNCSLLGVDLIVYSFTATQNNVTINLDPSHPNLLINHNGLQTTTPFDRTKGDITIQISYDTSDAITGLYPNYLYYGNDSITKKDQEAYFSHHFSGSLNIDGGLTVKGKRVLTYGYLDGIYDLLENSSITTDNTIETIIFAGDAATFWGGTVGVQVIYWYNKDDNRSKNHGTTFTLETLGKTDYSTLLTFVTDPDGNTDQRSVEVFIKIENNILQFGYRHRVPVYENPKVHVIFSFGNVRTV